MSGQETMDFFAPMSEEEEKAKIKAMRDGEPMAREGMYWSEEEDEAVLFKFYVSTYPQQGSQSSTSGRSRRSSSASAFWMPSGTAGKNAPIGRKTSPTHPGAYANTARWTELFVPAVSIIKETRRKYKCLNNIRIF